MAYASAQFRNKASAFITLERRGNYLKSLSKTRWNYDSPSLQPPSSYISANFKETLEKNQMR
jgi:hypothetical protein